MKANRLRPILEAIGEIKCDTKQLRDLKEAIEIEYIKQDVLDELEGGRFPLEPGVASIIAPLGTIYTGGSVWFDVDGGSWPCSSVLEIIVEDFRGGDLRTWLPNHLREVTAAGDDE